MYNVSLKTGDTGVNLRFTSDAAGWKGQHALGCTFWFKKIFCKNSAELYTKQKKWKEAGLY